MKSILFLSLVLTYSLPIFSDECPLKRARVNYSLRENNLKYYWVGNLDRQIIVSIPDRESNSQLAKNLQASDADTSVFLNLQLDNRICNQLRTVPRGLFLPTDYVKKISLAPNKSAESTNAMMCTTLVNAPLAMTLPSISEMRKILDKAAGLSSEKVEMTANMIVHLFERMNTKTINANGVIFMISLFRAFDLLGLEKINHDQLEYLTATFKEKLEPNEFQLLEKIMAQVDSISFSRNKAGNLKVSLNSVGGKTITLNGKDIPTHDEATQKTLEKYFNKIEIANGTSMEFNDSKVQINPLKDKKDAGMSAFEINSISKPSTVTINGIRIAGQFPIIGGISVNPKKLDVDIDQKTPVKASVGFKKGFINLSYTFDLNN